MSLIIKPRSLTTESLIKQRVNHQLKWIVYHSVVNILRVLWLPLKYCAIRKILFLIDYRFQDIFGIFLQFL